MKPEENFWVSKKSVFFPWKILVSWVCFSTKKKVKTIEFCLLKFCQTAIIWGWLTGLVAQQRCWSENTVPGQIHFHFSSNSLSRGYIAVPEAAAKSQHSCLPGECLPSGLQSWIPLPLPCGPLTCTFFPLPLSASNRHNTPWMWLGAEVCLLGGRNLKGHKDYKLWLKSPVPKTINVLTWGTRSKVDLGWVILSTERALERMNLGWKIMAESW